MTVTPNQQRVILEVAIPSPLYRCFDYRLPPALPVPAPGTRVLVPFGRRRVVGIVMADKSASDLSDDKLKTIQEILDTDPVFGPDLLQLLGWAADYYHHPIGETLATALPVLLRKPRAAGAAADTQSVWALTAQGAHQDPAGLKRAVRQASVLQTLRLHPEGLSRATLDCPAAVLNALRDKGWIEQRTAPRPTDATTVGDTDTAPPLSERQREAVDAVLAESGRFAPFLLEGVTGSGKTEVYLQLIRQQLDAGRQVLVLVPEIGLTPQLVARFRQRFRGTLPVLHSALNDTERLRAWRQAASGEAALVLGTRSAVFTPLRRAGLIVVDEEHDTAFKQQDGLRYSARDLAVWRARQLGVPVLLGSATPSLESLYNVRQGRYRHLVLPERAGNALHPTFRLLDLRGQGMRDLLSDTLIEAMRSHLARGAQVLLFLNRRGYAPVLLCHACGWVAECRRCDARMTVHQGSGELRCHHCGSQRRIDPFCPQCGSSELVGIGEGTERIEHSLKALFPGETVLRIDRDSTRRKGELERALDSARHGQARILLGTQMLAKGHHFPGVTLVGVLDADQGLFSSDFRASERMAQMIVQVAGRAGRAERPGEVMVQTHHPDHPLLVQLVGEGYPAFADAALAERREAQLPPYAALALLRAEATDAARARAFLDEAQALADRLDTREVSLWGPVAAPMERRAGRYRAQLLLQSAQRGALQRLLAQWTPALQSLKSARQVRWSLDVDPADTY